MSERKEFKLPDVGEGLTEAEIIKWHVQPGDQVTVNQIIVEIETAKAVVELPCPYAGVVSGLLVPEGTTAGELAAAPLHWQAVPIGDPHDGDRLVWFTPSEAEPWRKPAAGGGRAAGRPAGRHSGRPGARAA